MQASDVYHSVLCGINSSIQVFKCAFVMYSIKETHGLMECRLIMGFYHNTFSDSSKMHLLISTYYAECQNISVTWIFETLDLISQS